MERKLLITLHLDAFNMAVGGAFTVYDHEGRKISTFVVPSFNGGEQTAPDAAADIARIYEAMCGRWSELKLWSDDEGVEAAGT